MYAYIFLIFFYQNYLHWNLLYQNHPKKFLSSAINLDIFFNHIFTFFLKTFQDNSFHLFYKLNQSILLIFIEKISVDLSLIRCYFSFQIFCIIYRFTITFFFDVIADFFSQISLYLSINSSFFTYQKRYLVSSKFLLYAFIFRRNMHKGLIFVAFLQPTSFLKFFLPKETLLETTILFLSVLFEIGLLCW